MGKVSDLTAATAFASDDLIAVVDVSDTALAHPAGNSVKATLEQLATAFASIGSYTTDSELSAALATASSVGGNLYLFANYY